jgi:protein gp37
MAEKTKIQWCHHTFNPWRGCAKVHDGCKMCYAEREAKRFPANRGIWGPHGTRVRASEAMWREPLKWNAAAELAGERRRVFCASLADVFEDWRGNIVDHHGSRIWRLREGGGTLKTQVHCAFRGCYFPERPQFNFGGLRPATMDDLRHDLFAVIDCTPWLDWLLVTKRPEHIRKFWYHADRSESRRDNVWLLTSVSDQETADVMVPRLMEHRDLAAVLGVSAEPLLGPIDFSDWIECTCSDAHGHCNVCLDGGLDWIILGGESGAKHGPSQARPCDVAWLIHGLRQCKRNDVACFVKQWGSYPCTGSPPNLHQIDLRDPKGGNLKEWKEWGYPEICVRQFPEPARKAVRA